MVVVMHDLVRLNEIVQLRLTPMTTVTVMMMGDGGDDSGVHRASGDERIAPTVLAEARVYGSMVAWVRSTEWKHTRNLNECRALAAAIDKLVEEGVSQDSVGVEMLVRRVMGVHMADSTGNWGVCDALQWSGPNSSLLPRSTLTGALRQAAQMERLTKQTTKLPVNRGNYGNYGDRDNSRGGNFNRDANRGGRPRFPNQQQQQQQQRANGAPAATGGAGQQ